MGQTQISVIKRVIRPWFTCVSIITIKLECFSKTIGDHVKGLPRGVLTNKHLVTFTGFRYYIKMHSQATPTLGDIEVDVVLKDIKNIHLSVHPPAGRVSISAPLHMNFETIRVFAISKLSWIKSQQKKMQAQERATPREYLERESHYVWGKRYLLVVEEKDQPPGIELLQNRIIMRVRPGTDEHKRRSIAEEWYRGQVKEAVPSYRFEM